MLKTSIPATCAAALLLASCGPKSLALPDDPVERAATCGSVTAAAERAATTDIKAPLSLDAIGRVIHYPLLAGSTEGGFSAETASAVQKRMTEIQDKVVDRKWQDMVPVCHAAFPATAIVEVKLPADRFEAQLGCDELGDFLRTALEGQAPYADALADYGALGRKLETPLGAGLRSRVGSSIGAQQAERRKALAAMAALGPPITVMKACLARFD